MRALFFQISTSCSKPILTKSPEADSGLQCQITGQCLATS